MKPYEHIFTALQTSMFGTREQLDVALEEGSKINAIKILRSDFGQKRFSLREIKNVVDRYVRLMDYMVRVKWLHTQLEEKEKLFSDDIGIKNSRVRLYKLIKRHENNLKWFPTHIDMKHMNWLVEKHNLHIYKFKKTYTYPYKHSQRRND
tara:strand:+ start:216 stop:665 length:450 start_codon:yes stop_codon:yes gene_type:complete